MAEDSGGVGVEGGPFVATSEKPAPTPSTAVLALGPRRGEVHEWQDGDRTLRVLLQADPVVTRDGQVVPQDPATGFLNRAAIAGLQGLRQAPPARPASVCLCLSIGAGGVLAQVHPEASAIAPVRSGDVSPPASQDAAAFQDVPVGGERSTRANRPPRFPADEDGVRSVAENVAARTDIGAPVAAIDDDDELSYTLGGSDAESFDIVASSGQLRTKAPLDYEIKPSYAVTVTASDPSDDSVTIDVTVNVTNVRETETLSSPDGQVEVAIEVFDGDLHYAVSAGGVSLLDQSAVGIAFSDSLEDVGDVAVVGTSRRAVDTTWTPVWGKSSGVADRFNEITVQLQEVAAGERRFDVVFRTYDEGVAFRYSVESQSGLADEDTLLERTEFNFASDWPVHAVVGVERPPDGTMTTADFDSSNTPMLVLTGSAALAVHEAALLDYPPLFLEQGDDHSNLILADVESVEFAGSLLTPWRVLMVASDVGDLLKTQLLATLSPPSRVADPSFALPGKALWDRRIRKLTYGDIYYWFSTDAYTHMIDFAAENNIAYLVIDSNWYGDQRSANSNPLTARNGVDIEQILDHADHRGVGVILYINDIAFDNHSMDDVFETYGEWGVAGVKYGFLRGSSRSREKVLETTAAIEAAASHELLINFHDSPIHPTGLSRTFPNLITVEYSHAQLDAVRAFTPDDYLRSIFVHMLAGPLDVSNGLFGLDGISDRNNGGLDYNRRLPDVDSTVATEVARILITYSGMIILPDAPEEYAEKDDLFEFVREMPNGPWAETRVLNAGFAEHVTVARRHGREWFVGSVIDEDGGTLDIDLGFLDEGTTYAATIYGNASDSHYQTNREAYEIQQQVVDADDVLTAEMAPGGGHAVWLRPQSPLVFTGPDAFEVAENTVAVGRVQAEESGSEYRVSGYAVTGGADQDLFEITDDGELSFVLSPDFEQPEDAAGANEYVVIVEATSAARLDYEAKSSHEVTARAVDGNGGNGGNGGSDTIAVTISVTDVDEPPDAPAAPSVSPTGTDSVDVSWSAPDNTGPGITGYGVQYRKTGDQNWTAHTHSGTATSATIIGLAAGTAYEVRVRAVNDEGVGDWSPAGTGRTAALMANTSLTPSPDDPTVMSPSEAAYTITFTGAWTSTATPGGVPAGAHFSPLIGGVHNDQITFLEAGGTASAGVEQMAELGQANGLHSEVFSETLNNGNALSVLERGGNIGPTATVTLEATLTTDYPRVTLVTMIAPSPDWFVGVSGLSLLDGSGDWVASLTVDLYAWDAGTEDGTEFSLDNDDTDPQDTITSLRGIGKFSNDKIATLTFARGAVVSTDATLSGLSLSDGTLAPAFASDEYSYTASVGSSVSEVTVTPTLSDSNATVEYLDASDMALPDAGAAAGRQVSLVVGANTIRVKVTAQDTDTTQTYTVTVTRSAAANQAPVFDEGASTTREVAENTAAGVDVGSAVAATDANGDTLTYSLGGADAASFDIGALSGQIQTKARVSYDHETKPQYSVTVRAVDGRGGSDTIDVAITITDVDEPPVTGGGPAESVVVVGIDGPGFGAAGAETVFTATVGGDASAVLSWRVAGSGGFVAVGIGERFALTPPVGGSYTVTVTAAVEDDSVSDSLEFRVFSDIGGHGFADEIVWLAEQGITVGCGTEPLRYCPDRPVTRAQMATFLTRALDLPVPDQPAGFADVDPLGVHAPNIYAILAAGITVGCRAEPLRYCPDRPVTRAQMATFLTRALDLAIPGQPAGFTDVNPQSVHAPNIYAILAAGITVGCRAEPLRYCPDRPVTRAQMATFLTRALDLAN